MKLHLRLVCCITLFLILCSGLHAQSPNEVKGIVKDEKQNALEGVTVTEKGTHNAVATKADGSFTIKIKSTSSFVLVFTGVSLEKTEMKFTSKPDGIVNVTLKSQKSSLDEVVVIAYGKTTRRLASNSVVSLSAKQINDLPVASPAEAMIGMVAGASIVTPSGEPGQNPYIRIRGLGSIGAGNDPLFVVDGYPLNNTDNFYNIAPADIQSIQILKDAAACAIYGSRGGNGIILVTTKRGVAGKTKFSATVYHGITDVSKKIKLLDADQYMDYTKEAYANAGKTFPGALIDSTQWANTNWQDQIFKAANQDYYQLAASGGSDASRFYISGNYFNQQGVIPGTSFKRYMLRANYDAKLSSKLKLGMTIAPNFSTTYTMPVSGSFNSSSITNGGPANLGAVVTDALLLSPVIPVYKPNGDYGQLVNSFGNAIAIGGLYNPVATLGLYQDKTNALRGLFISYLEYEIIKNLSFKTSLGGESIFSRRNYYVPATLANGSAPSANLSNPVLAGINAEQLNSNTYNWVWENTLNYALTKGVHRFDALVGYGAQKNISEGSTVSGKASTYTSTDIQYVTAAGTILGTATYTASTLASVFGRVNYSYKSRYIFSAAIRTDGSSRFGANNRYATFPSVSAAWRVADESFMRKYSSVISELKLRTSYGVTGNNNIGDYSWQSYEQPSNYVLGSGTGTVNYGYAPNSIGNNSLTWETNTQLDMSMELGLLHNRIYLTVETYQRKTTNLLLNQNVPAVIGYATSILNNVGEVKNNGVDIQLQTINIDQKNFRWTTNFNIFWNKNTVVSLSSPSDQLLFDPVYGYTSAIRVVPGLPMGSFFGYKQIGVYKNATDVANSAVWSAGGSQPGDIKYADVNKQGVINANDIIYLGNPYPKYTYGMQNSFAYKNWTFGLSVQGSVGGLILNGADRYIYNFDGLTNARTNALNRWKSATDPGDGWTPRVVLNPPSSLTAFSSHELFDASFLRIKNVTVRYTLPSKLLGWAKVESASLYMMAQNLYTFQKYFGYNPEANLYGNSVTPTYGVDQGSYPLNRIVTFGANISF
jgi:TonB-linked SusC/RagA family outer membrane protein